MANRHESIADRAAQWDCDARLKGRDKKQIVGVAGYKDDFVRLMLKLYEAWDGDTEGADDFIGPILKDLGSRS